MIFSIEIPEKISLNRIYAGVHYRERAEVKEDYHYAVMDAKVKPYTGKFPVEVHYHFKTNGKPLDISNHGFMVKMVEDGLVECGVIPDDTQKYVSKISTTAETTKDKQVVIVEIKERNINV